jgi:hypothetical protein
MMDITRNQFFLVGLLLLLLGVQFRLIESIELTPELTQLLADRTSKPLASVSTAAQSLIPGDRTMVKRTVRPPEWLGWFLASIGGVLILHSLAMKKPGAP